MRKVVALVAVIIASSAFADATPDGAALFKSNCAICHGPDAKGQTVVGKSQKLRDLASAEVQKQSDQELGAIMANGKGKMPAFKAKLSGDEIKTLVGFIRALKE